MVRDPVTRLLSDYSQLAAKWRYQRWSRRMQMRGSGGGELHLQDGSLDTSGFSTSPPSPTDGNLLDFEHFVTRRENNQANSRYSQKNIISTRGEGVSQNSTYFLGDRKPIGKFYQSRGEERPSTAFKNPFVGCLRTYYLDAPLQQVIDALDCNPFVSTVACCRLYSHHAPQIVHT